MLVQKSLSPSKGYERSIYKNKPFSIGDVGTPVSSPAKCHQRKTNGRDLLAALDCPAVFTKLVDIDEKVAQGYKMCHPRYMAQLSPRRESKTKEEVDSLVRAGKTMNNVASPAKVFFQTPTYRFTTSVPASIAPLGTQEAVSSLRCVVEARCPAQFPPRRESEALTIPPSLLAQSSMQDVAPTGNPRKADNDIIKSPRKAPMIPRTVVETITAEYKPFDPRYTAQFFGSIESRKPAMTERSESTRILSQNQSIAQRRASMTSVSRTAQALPKRHSLVEPNQSRCAAWMVDEQYLKSKVYATLLYCSASTIQKWVKGFIHRARYRVNRRQKIEDDIAATNNGAATRIQAIARMSIRRSIFRRTRATCTIQTVFRSWRTQMHLRLDFLQLRRRNIEQQRLLELETIRADKEKELATFKERFMQTLEDTEERRTIERLSMVMAALKRDNKKIRAENDKLAAECQALLEKNKILEMKASICNLESEAMKESIVKLEKEELFWYDVIRQLEVRRIQFERAVERRLDYVDFEKKVRSSFCGAVGGIVAHIRSECKDEALVDYIQDISETQDCTESSW